jgi:DNA mismatch repair protein MutH
MAVLPSPRSESELLARAERLRGRSAASIAAELGLPDDFAGVRAKGKIGTLVERALGAEGGSAATWDFPSVRVELKTIPVEAGGVPRESTYVCTVSLADAERAEWVSSWARAKLSRVLWIPVTRGDAADPAIRIGDPRLWSPSPAQ